MTKKIADIPTHKWTGLCIWSVWANSLNLAINVGWQNSQSDNVAEQNGRFVNKGSDADH